MSYCRILAIAVPLFASLALMSTAPAEAPTASAWRGPSSLDYVVLASLADSSNIVAMSAYIMR